MDKYRGDTGAGGFGNWDGQVGAFQPTVRKKKSEKLKLEKSNPKDMETEKPEVDYVSENRDQIVIRFPAHNSLDQIRYEIVDGNLEVRSLLVDFLEKFRLPDFPVVIKADFRNAVLDIRLEEKAKES